MRRSVFILSLTTVALASSTAYLARELYLRDAGGLPATSSDLAAASGEPLDADMTPLAGEAGVDQSTEDASASVASLTSANETATPEVAAKTDVQADAGRLFARQFLARYDDPVQRAALLDEAKAGVRRQYARLKEQLKLSAATFEELVTLLADENLLIQEHFSRCAVDPRCDMNDPSRRTPYDAHSQEFLALLGTERIEAFTAFRGSIGERDAVIQLRGRLPDSSFLPEAQAEQLITVLADERERYQREASAQGAKVGGWGTQLGMLMYIQDSGSVDQYVIEATKYSDRLRTRAASVLSPAQLAAYAQMQDELLAQMASYLRPTPAPRKGNSATIRSS